ncbi:MAG: PAS domain-containing protein, partial [Gemmatimonadaceae bacterium]|nr:PAS domain-containing protein [Gemmatimonadaceae bacterium]
MVEFIGKADNRIRLALDPHRLIRWLYTSRISIATAIFLAAVIQWQSAEKEKTLVATLSFALALVFTIASFVHTELNRQPLTETFRYTQALFDVLMVTAVVHVTGGPQSQFAALYILVNTAAALFLPLGGALLITAFGAVCYAADVIIFNDGPRSIALLLQLIVFSVVALGTGYIAARLQEAGIGREALQAELASVRLRAADILANIRSGIVTIDAKGALLYANGMADDLLGTSLSAWMGRPVLGELAARVPVLGDALERAAREQVHLARVEGEVGRNGRTIPIGITTTSSGADDRTRTATAIFADISDQKALEQLNLRASRLEAVAELAASLAHEIKNPLASIRSAVEQLSVRATADADDRTLGGLIVRESDRLSRLLTEFLDFARVRVAQWAPIDLGQVVRAAATLAGAHPTRPDGAKVELVVPTFALPIEADEDLVHRAVFNLVLNGLQASAAGGTVRVETRDASAVAPRGVALDGGGFAIVITDTGSGIAESVRERLFEPFATTKPGGSGLGLAVAQRAVAAHRGYITVDSSPDGTR